MRVIARIGSVLLLPALLGGVAVAAHASKADPLRSSDPIVISLPDREPFIATASAVGPSRAQPEADDDSDSIDETGSVDLYGNDVTSAVATYKLDAEGSLYELHSPQTELPRLGSPKS